MIIELFGGPGGWAEGLRSHGHHAIGIEIDAAACSTRAAAGHRTIRADVTHLPTTPFVGKVTGLIASPPCPTFSAAGKGAGRAILTELAAAIGDHFDSYSMLDGRHVTHMAQALEAVHGADNHDWCLAQAREAMLTTEPARWIRALRPRWVAFEQVPAVLPLWRAYARRLRQLGYSVWCGILNAADFGVPQTRQRAFLIASLDRPVRPPEPTHCKGGADTLFGGLEPWVSMAEALGWDGSTLIGFPRRDDRGDSPDGYRERDMRLADKPALALTEKGRSWVLRPGAQDKATIRDVDEPAPIRAFGNDMAQWQFVLNTGRDWKPGGTRDDAQQIPLTQPAPAVDGSGMGAGRWWLTRPATTLAGDPRCFTPGGHIANDGRDNSRMLGRSEAAIRLTIADALVLQSFRPDYPVDGLRNAPHVAPGRSVEDDHAFADQLVRDGLKRAVHVSVLPLPGEDDEVLQGVVVPQSVDVMHDLVRLRPGHQAVFRHQRAAGEDVTTVDPHCSGGLPALVRVERITVKPPLLPVLGAEAACDGLAFAVLARRLRWPTLKAEGAVPGPLVVHEAEALSGVLPIAAFDLAVAHRSGYRHAGMTKTKQFEQVGNAVPPLLAAAVLSAVLPHQRATVASMTQEETTPWD